VTASISRSQFAEFSSQTTGFSEGSAHAVFMVDRVALELVSRDLLFHPVSIISPVPSAHLMMVLPEGQADESLVPFDKATLSEASDRGQQ
jgi:hypothetical protein